MTRGVAWDDTPGAPKRVVGSRPAVSVADLANRRKQAMLATRTYEYLTLEAEDGIGILTLTRPKKRNALGLAVMRELITALEAVGADRSVRKSRPILPARSTRQRSNLSADADGEEVGRAASV